MQLLDNTLISQIILILASKAAYLAFPRFLLADLLALPGLTLIEFQLTVVNVSEQLKKT
ncbi:hypothetical protein WDZ92_03345 [Nostoc sp. NIES-2111]